MSCEVALSRDNRSFRNVYKIVHSELKLIVSRRARDPEEEETNQLLGRNLIKMTEFLGRLCVSGATRVGICDRYDH